MPQQRKIVTAAPENSETPLEALRGWVTPTRLFFVRNHFPVPSRNPGTWTLTVEGAVRRRHSWSGQELLDMPQRTVFATVECAGNGRSFLQPHAHGVQWGSGAVGHAEWTGVPLRSLLEEAGLQASAVEVLCEGADRGTESDHPEPMYFARSLPLAKALHPDTLLALHMNGEPLEPEHGAPVRLFVPGWYGVASVKWLRRIEVLTRPFQGYFQTVKYTRQRRTRSGLETEVIGPMEVKAEIIRPRSGEILGPGGNRLFGVAWAGEDEVAAVEVSTDGGATWNAATLLGMQAPYSWTLWEYVWEIDAPGEYAVLVRATAAGGKAQPREHDPLNGGYCIHHSRPLPVRVQAGRPRYEAPADVDTLMYDMNAFAEENRRLPLDVDLVFTAGEGI
jgi:DMSO/TMAO reductase YedYZ molybdopterin-dependent catalytic subunit